MRRPVGESPRLILSAAGADRPTRACDRVEPDDATALNTRRRRLQSELEDREVASEAFSVMPRPADVCSMRRLVEGLTLGVTKIMLWPPLHDDLRC
jgi:hypothetical protein